MTPREKIMAVYIVTNKYKTVLYTGVTNNISRRLWEHEENIKLGNTTFTGRYRAHYLLYVEYYENPKEAILREKEIKGWTRAKKEALINEVNPEWRFLNDDIEPEGW
jgi:putative endonuclease